MGDVYLEGDSASTPWMCVLLDLAVRPLQEGIRLMYTDTKTEPEERASRGSALPSSGSLQTATLTDQNWGWNRRGTADNGALRPLEEEWSRSSSTSMDNFRFTILKKNQRCRALYVFMEKTGQGGCLYSSTPEQPSYWGPQASSGAASPGIF